MRLEVLHRFTFRKRLRNTQREGAIADGSGATLSRCHAFAFVEVAARYLIWQVLVCRLRPEKVLH